MMAGEGGCGGGVEKTGEGDREGSEKGDAALLGLGFLFWG